MPFERPRHVWRLPDGEIPLGARTYVMGVLDLSVERSAERPDPAAWLDEALRIEMLGADFLDLAVLPARPAPRRLDPDAELRRIVPVLKKIRSRVDIPIAVTTYNAETAARAAELGAAIINDPSGLAFDRDMAKTINASDAALILGNAPDAPETWDRSQPIVRLMEMLRTDLSSSIGRANRAGVHPRRVIVDPGFDLGKKGPQNFEILDRLRDLTKLQRPVLVSPSRKPFLTDSVRAPELDWTMAAAVIVGLAVRGGAHIVRVLEVEEMVAAARTADRFLQALEGPRGA